VLEQRVHGLLLHCRQLPAESDPEPLACNALVVDFQSDAELA
jgi:hypothetical protein